MKVCLVTIAIGAEYVKKYNALFRKSQELYAKRHGYDFKVLTEYLSTEHHQDLISLNKILVSSCSWSSSYDFVVYIDADILVNSKAPAIHTQYDFGDQIGVVNQSQPNLELWLRGQTIKGFEDGQTYYKAKANLELDTDHVINTGVLVTQPKKHGEFLKNVFETYKHAQIGNKHRFHFEQAVVGYEIQKQNKFLFMDMKWNALWAYFRFYGEHNMLPKVSLQSFCQTNYFIHFAGQTDHGKVPSIRY
jgi:hypothetical protein